MVCFGTGFGCGRRWFQLQSISLIVLSVTFKFIHQHLDGVGLVADEVYDDYGSCSPSCT